MESDTLLDRYMPNFDVAERHSIRVSAPAEVTLAAACELDLRQSRLVRTLFRCRELILGSRPASDDGPLGLIAWTNKIGWGLLAELPGREIVMGAITQPWSPNVVFRAVSAEQFASHSEPGHVKIAWTLRADPMGNDASIFRTETRVVACDAEARSKFRRYWRMFSLGIILIRLVMLRPLKKEAERRAHTAAFADSFVHR